MKRRATLEISQFIMLWQNTIHAALVIVILIIIISNTTVFSCTTTDLVEESGLETLATEGEEGQIPPDDDEDDN